MVGLYMIYCLAWSLMWGLLALFPVAISLAFRIQTLLSLRRSGMNSYYEGDCLKKNFTAKL